MIISFLNLKGGVGKTTSALATATVAAKADRLVRVLDADEQGSAMLWAKRAAEAGDPLPFDVATANIATIEGLSENDKLTIIDCPSTGKVLDVAKDASDFIIVPCAPRLMDIEKTFQVTATLEAAERPYAVLITCAYPGSHLLKTTVGSLRERNISFFDSVINTRDDIVEAFGCSLNESSLGDYTKAYFELLEALG